MTRTSKFDRNSYGRSLIYSMGRIVANANARLEKRISPLGISILGFRALFVLSRLSSRTVKQLARDIIAPPSTVSRLLARLERARLVRRTIESADKRLVTVHLTASGRQTLRRAQKLAGQEYASMLETVSPHDLIRFRKLILHLIAKVIPAGEWDERLNTVESVSTQLFMQGRPCSGGRPRPGYLTNAVRSPRRRRAAG
jgi:DNA-binding MarR family transcriptional regulator